MLHLICRGFTNRRIAAQLGIALATVNVHRARLLTQFQVHTAAQLVQATAKLGLIPGGTARTQMSSPEGRRLDTTEAPAGLGRSDLPDIRSRRMSHHEPKRLGKLTPRQRQVVTLACDGLTNREIGERLGISKRTVEVHRFNLMRRLRVHNIAQLYQAAIRLGLKRRSRPRRAFGERRR